MKNRLLSMILALSMAVTLLPGALAADHVCAEGEWEDHFCDVCAATLSELCADTDGDHYCDVCWLLVDRLCADADGNEYCDLCESHMVDACADTDGNHVCDVCWRVLSICLDENKDHLCDICATVFWVNENADGRCDGCDAILTHVGTEHKEVYYHVKDGATVADVVIEVTVMPYVDDGGAPAGTVAVRWTDEDGRSYATADAALTFGATTVTVECPSLPMEVLKSGGRVVFTPYDAGFTPAENGCVIEYDLPSLRVDSDAEFTVNGVSEGLLYLLPGTPVTVEQGTGLTDRWEWVIEEGYASPELTVDGLTTTFVMPEEDVNIFDSWRCEVCTDADGDNWCDVCWYYVDATVPMQDVDPDAWYADAVSYVLEQELMDPAMDGIFDPEGEAVRADVIYALWMLEGCPQVNYILPFSDVEPEEKYTEAIRWAAAEGIAKGDTEGTFRPCEGITREEMATFLYRYAQYHGGGFTGMWMFLLNCTDRDQVSEWAYEPLCWLTMKGVMQGRGNGALEPKAVATRAQMAQLLQNYLELEV